MKGNFFGIRWIYFPFFIMFHICVTSKQRATLQWIMKGLYSSLASLLPSARANHNIHSLPPCLWMRCRAQYHRDRSQTGPCENKKPSTICTADISHTSERARASGVHLSVLCGIWSCRNVMPPCGLCAGTSVSCMTCVECSWTILLVCVCPEFQCLFSAV